MARYQAPLTDLLANEQLARELVAASGGKRERLVVVVQRILEDERFADALRSGTISPADAFKDTPDDRVLASVSAARAADTPLAATTRLHRCGKCGTADASYREEQTRSADEPMTLFLTCRKCGHAWTK